MWTKQSYLKVQQRDNNYETKSCICAKASAKQLNCFNQSVEILGSVGVQIISGDIFGDVVKNW